MPVNIKELIDNGYIVICDTNVYLHIYRFSPEFSDFALRCITEIIKSQNLQTICHFGASIMNSRRNLLRQML